MTKGAIGIHGLYLVEEIDGVSVAKTVDSTRVIGNHAAYRAVIAAGRVWWQEFASFPELQVKDGL
jgi:hypothetical protein